MSDKVAVVARNLTKKFNSFVAVDGISFEVRAGECMAFLGPNGAGKTSALRMITCVSPRSGGDLFVLDMDVGKDCARIKSQIGIMPQENNLDIEFSVMENMLLYARYFGIPHDQAKERANRLLEFVQLSDKNDVNVEKLSTGMKRRALFARALLNNPKLLILDEPTTGLDPQARHLLWDRLRELKQEGVTIILATHYMEEAELLSDRVLIIDRGKILVESPPKELIKKFIGSEVLEIFSRDQNLIAYLSSEKVDFEVVSDGVFIFHNESDMLLKRLRSLFQFPEYTIRKATLEDVFLKLTGRGLRE